MTDLLPSFSTLGIFIAASLVLAITPGPGVLYIVTRSISQGRAAGLASVAGVAIGNFCNALGASLGLAALFAISSLAFIIVKYLGAAYLIYIGVKTIRNANAKTDIENVNLTPASPKRIFMDGLLVALLNPKTALFFAAFLPQFIHAGHALMAQTIVLGLVFVIVAAITDSLYVMLSSFIRPFLQRNQNAGPIGSYLSGGTFIGLGLLTAFSGSSK